MTYQHHPQPRYFAVAAFFSFFVVAQGARALVDEQATGGLMSREPGMVAGLALWAGWVVLGLAVGLNAAWTLDYAAHPEYTFVNAAQRLTRYIDQHPNGRRLLVAASGDEITPITHLPTLNDAFIAPNPAIPDLAARLDSFQPGWYASWNYLDAGALEDLHTHYWVEQVAVFRAFDDSDRNLLVLFKLHPWPGGKVYEPADRELGVRFPEDRFDIPMQ